MQSELVSILIPVYNRENLIEETIQSAINQTYKNIEIVVADNKSTDNTWKILQQFAFKDSRVKIFQNEINLGPVKNWKRCIDEASGKYGKILFSDDVIFPDFLEKALDLIDEEVAFVFSSVAMGENVNKTKTAYKFKEDSGIYNINDFFYSSLYGGDLPVSPGCALFHLNYLKENLLLDIISPSVNDFLNHGAGPDLLLYFNTFNKYKKVGFINEPLTFFREHEGSFSISDKSKHLFRCYVQARILFAKNYLDENKFKEYLAQTWFYYSKYSNKYDLPNSFTSKYLYEKININVPVIKFFIVKLYKKLFGINK
jgi:glycosyltransferase involved in cell wall biosynthesis